MQLNNQTIELFEKTLTGKGDACILSTVGTDGDSENIQTAITGSGMDIMLMALGIVRDAANALPDDVKRGFYKTVKQMVEREMQK